MKDRFRQVAERTTIGYRLGSSTWWHQEAYSIGNLTNTRHACNLLPCCHLLGTFCSNRHSFWMNIPLQSSRCELYSFVGEASSTCHCHFPPLRGIITENVYPGDENAATCRDICTNIDQNVAAMDLAISALKEQRDKLQSKRAWHRQLLLIVHRLPDDVLAEIFAQTLHMKTVDMAVSVPPTWSRSRLLLLTSVSKRRRSVALSLPQLWSFLPLPFQYAYLCLSHTSSMGLDLHTRGKVARHSPDSVLRRRTATSARSDVRGRFL